MPGKEHLNFTVLPVVATTGDDRRDPLITALAELMYFGLVQVCLFIIKIKN